MGFAGGSDVKESTCNVGDMGLIPELGRFPERRRHGNPLQYSFLENPHGQIRSDFSSIPLPALTEHIFDRIILKNIRWQADGQSLD